MDKKTIASALTGALLIGMAGGVAGSSRHYGQESETAMYYDYAKVTRVEPVYEYGPSGDCGYQPAAISPGGQGRTAVTGMVVGGVVGGLIGSQVAGSGHRTTGAVAGAATGAAAGYFLGKNGKGGRNNDAYGYDSGCRGDRHGYVTGYDVTYKYNGQRFQTWLPYDPGKRLRLQVAIQPDV